MDQTDPLKNALDHANGGMGRSQGAGDLRQTDSNNKRAAVQAEMGRMNQLPSNSSYVAHRMRVLRKLLHLMSIPRVSPLEEMKAKKCLNYLPQSMEFNQQSWW